ncbi:MAG TPA: ribonuclease HII [Rhodospirillaceae bacterium]|nr:MAG: ribonuclease HII [Alphaproteobacteria bacterium GWF2_58_20]HAU28859.1 ribonuclease HII [Rhodospirillaceae bacterium]
MPGFELEKACSGCVCGIDEVGRGPLAGPVLAAAVVLPQSLPESLLVAIDDSKKLSAAQRVDICARLMALPGIAVGMGEADVAEIDRINILQATFLAMRRAFDALPLVPQMALIDGNRIPKGFPCKALAVVKGDGISLSIAAASIIAKVRRDAIMAELAMEHPEYGWGANAGYGTPAHMAALEQFGATRHHRRSFAPVSRVQGKLSF